MIKMPPLKGGIFNVCHDQGDRMQGKVVWGICLLK